MKNKTRSRIWIQILCWILIAMMIVGAITYTLYALLGLF